MKVYNCDRCSKTLASPQSLWNHRQRCKASAIGPQETTGNGLIVRPKFGSTPVHKEKFIADNINNVTQSVRDQGSTSNLPKERMNSVLPNILSDLPLKLDSETDSDPEASDAEISKDIEFMPHNEQDTDDKMDSDESDSESVKDGPLLIKDIDNSTLIDIFQNLNSHFDEDDIENCNDILRLLEELRIRKCITYSEYTHIKNLLRQQIQIYSYKSINSTVENMIQDDKDEILGLLRSMKKDPVAKRLLVMVKDYLEKKLDLESVLGPIRKLKDKVNAQKLKIILNQIEKTKKRVNEIFTRIVNGRNKGEVLGDLKRTNHITDEQYEKLTIGPHTLPSISRIIQGRGLYLRRK